MLPQLSFVGSPLLPPEILTAYVSLFIGLLIVVYLILHQHFRPVHINQKLSLLLGTTLGLKLALGMTTLIVLSYWIVPIPQVVATTPTHNYTNTTTHNKIEITFDRPVARQPIVKHITPEAPGIWVFEEPVYGTHLYYKLVFYPAFSLTPNTTYVVGINNIRNLVQFSDPVDYSFTFTTQPIPNVERVVPANGQTQVEINDPINIHLTSPNNNLSELSYHLSPEADLDMVYDDTHQFYQLLPQKPLVQGIQYTLTLYQTPVSWDLTSNTISSRQEKRQIYQGTFTTKQAPGIKTILPNSLGSLVNEPISITFTQPMVTESVQEHFSISPQVKGQFLWTNDTTMVFTPQSLAYGTTYRVAISKGAGTKTDGFLESDVIANFTTVGHVEVTDFTPQDLWTGVSVHTPIKVEFDQELEQGSAQEHFSIEPKIIGDFSWTGNTMIYTPKQPLEHSTSYSVTISPGVSSKYGLDSVEKYSISFTTQHQVVKINVPIHLQEHTLSCEAATLKMALSYRGVTVPETELIHKIGFDPTPKSDHIWGNPHVAFVGDIDGKQMKTGYGVYWEPIASVARMYRPSRVFSGWTLLQLTTEIANNNPVIVWGYAKGGVPITWSTQDGQLINAVSGEHTFVVTGYVGKAENPVQVILNDPLVGEVYMGISEFNNKWSSLGNSGVIVN